VAILTSVASDTAVSYGEMMGKILTKAALVEIESIIVLA
jgi:hypothetical protein